MIALGIILLVLGFLLGIYALWIAGIILLVLGAALLFFGPPAHRRYYW
jgi:hypothetical protein